LEHKPPGPAEKLHFATKGPRTQPLEISGIQNNYISRRQPPSKIEIVGKRFEGFSLNNVGHSRHVSNHILTPTAGRRAGPSFGIFEGFGVCPFPFPFPCLSLSPFSFGAFRGPSYPCVQGFFLPSFSSPWSCDQRRLDHQHIFSLCTFLPAHNPREKEGHYATYSR
jgi:hypothetical protein